MSPPSFERCSNECISVPQPGIDTRGGLPRRKDIDSANQGQEQTKPEYYKSTEIETIDANARINSGQTFLETAERTPKEPRNRHPIARHSTVKPKPMIDKRAALQKLVSSLDGMSTRRKLFYAAAATIIQSAVRGFLVELRLLAWRSAAVRGQGAWRGAAVRAKYSAARRVAVVAANDAKTGRNLPASAEHSKRSERADDTYLIQLRRIRRNRRDIQHRRAVSASDAARNNLCSKYVAPRAPRKNPPEGRATLPPTAIPIKMKCVEKKIDAGLLNAAEDGVAGPKMAVGTIQTAAKHKGAPNKSSKTSASTDSTSSTANGGHIQARGEMKDASHEQAERIGTFLSEAAMAFLSEASIASCHKNTTSISHDKKQRSKSTSSVGPEVDRAEMSSCSVCTDEPWKVVYHTKEREDGLRVRVMDLGPPPATFTFAK